MSKLFTRTFLTFLISDKVHKNGSNRVDRSVAFRGIFSISRWKEIELDFSILSGIASSLNVIAPTEGRLVILSPQHNVEYFRERNFGKTIIVRDFDFLPNKNPSPYERIENLYPSMQSGSVELIKSSDELNEAYRTGDLREILVVHSRWDVRYGNTTKSRNRYHSVGGSHLSTTHCVLPIPLICE